MSAVIILARKDLLLLMRNKGARFFVFVWPVITAVMFGVLFSGGGTPGKPRVAWVDADRTPASQALLASLKSSGDMEIDELGADAARDMVRAGKRALVVEVPAGYGAAAQRVFYGEPARLNLIFDPSRRAEQSMVEGMLMAQAGGALGKRLTDPTLASVWIAQARAESGSAPEAMQASTNTFYDALEKFLATQQSAAPAPATAQKNEWQPLVIAHETIERKRVGPSNAFAITFPQGMLWGIVGCMMTFASSLVLEHVQGTLVRLRASPMDGARILMGKGMACGVAIVGLVTALTLMAVIGFQVRPNSIVLLVLAAGAAAIAFTGIMMLIASLGTTVQTVGGTGWAIMMPLMMLGGGMIPLFMMPPWMQSLSMISPVRWAVLGLEGAIWRDFGLAEMVTPVAVLVATGVVAFLIGARRFSARTA